MTSPTGKTLDRLREQGFLAAVVERWLPKIDRRKDLFGFADVLAVHPRDRLFLLVQATSAGHVADRLKKAQGRPELALWLRAWGRFEVWGWDGARLKRVAVSAQDLQPVLLEKPPRRGRQRARGLFDGLAVEVAPEAPGASQADPPGPPGANGAGGAGLG